MLLPLVSTVVDLIGVFASLHSAHCCCDPQHGCFSLVAVVQTCDGACTVAPHSPDAEWFDLVYLCTMCCRSFLEQLQQSLDLDALDTPPALMAVVHISSCLQGE